MTDSTRTVQQPGTPATPRPGVDRLRWILPLVALIFIVEGLLLIPYPGIQNDEALFGYGIYQPLAYAGKLRAFHHDVPIMLMSYVGALKAWLYAGIFKLWPPSPYSIRVPVLLAGALTIWLFGMLLRDTLGRRAALIGAALLAADTTFLLTTTFDWGPVALQHLLLMSGIVLLVRFHQRGGLGLLAGGFFALGLGMWDKAIFAWMLAGLTVAALAVFPRAVFSKLRWRNVGVAAAAFLVGAAPLILYNVRSGFATFRNNAVYSPENIRFKAYLVESAMEGSSLFGYLVHDQAPPQPGQPRSALERASMALSDAAGRPRVGFLFLAALLSALLLPLVWRTPARKAMLFSAVFVAVTWVQMAFLKDAGGGAHHTVLLWPFPHLFVAAALAEASRRWRRGGLVAAVAVVAVVCASDALVTNEHLAQFVRNGPGPVWTDAIYPLSDAAGKLPARQLFIMDWGIMDGLRLLGRGRLPLYVGSDPFMRDAMTPDDLRFFKWMLSQPDTYFIGHTAGNEVHSGVSARFEKAIREAGLSREVLQVVPDSHGRPTFEIFRLARST